MRELQFGDRGAEVGYLQRLLNLENVYIANADAELREDCSFGPRTLARLNSHQHTMGLPPSDRVDARMWQQLGHLIAVEHAVELFPVFGAVSGTPACIGAMEAIKLITGIGQPLAGEMLSMNFESMQFRKVRLPKRADCAVCGS